MRRSLLIATALLAATTTPLPVAASPATPVPNTVATQQAPIITYGVYEIPMGPDRTIQPHVEGEIPAGTIFTIGMDPEKEWAYTSWKFDINAETGEVTVSTPVPPGAPIIQKYSATLYVGAKFPDGTGSSDYLRISAYDPRPKLADIHDFTRADLITSVPYPKYNVPTLSEGFPEGVRFSIANTAAWRQASREGWRIEDVSARTQYGALKVTPWGRGPDTYTFTATARYPDGSIDEIPWTVTRETPTTTPTPPAPQPSGARSGSSLSS